MPLSGAETTARYFKRHPNKCRAASLKYYQKNRDRINIERKDRLQNDPDYRSKIHEAHRRWRRTKGFYPKRIYDLYRRGAIRRFGSFTLTIEEFMQFWQKPCFYCGGEIKTAGIDRIDNDKSYVEGNMVPCCRMCNRAKWIFTKDEFLDMCRTVANRHP